MSDWLLYHVWGIRGYRTIQCEKLTANACVVYIEPLASVIRCPRCGSKEVVRKGSKMRLFLGTPVGRRQMYFEAKIPRVRCDSCAITRQVRIPFAEEKHRHTRQFERFALELAQITTTQLAAEHLGVSWDTVRDIEASSLTRKYRQPRLRHLKRIAIDEIYLGKGMKYLTVVLDLESGAIVFIGRGKGASSLAPFWKRLRGSRAKVQAVAADMSPAYAKAVRENLPHAVLVNDRFHVIKLYNEMLTELRRELYREATKFQRKVLKGIRWLLLKRTENLDDKKGEPRRLLRALKLNESLAIAYYMKDDLNQFWEQPDKATAAKFLDAWLQDAWSSGIRLLIKFAKTLAAHRRGLLAWYDHPISTGPLEAVNNKIRLLNRQAYGFRDLEFFTLKLFALHNSRYALVG
jgi:transposase